MTEQANARSVALFGLRLSTVQLPAFDTLPYLCQPQGTIGVCGPGGTQCVTTTKQLRVWQTALVSQLESELENQLKQGLSRTHQSAPLTVTK